MEFWGVEVKPGQSLKCNPGEDKYIHLSQAAIGVIKKDKNSQSVPLFVTFEGKKLVIGTLSSDSCLQISYDLVFEKEFELSHNWKDGSVYFTGYKTVIADEELEGYSDDSESEDLEAVPLDNKANGKAAEKPEKQVAAAAKPKAEPSKAKSKPAEATKVDEDEDDDDDEDGSKDDESDEEMAEGEDDSGSDDDEDEDDSSEEDVKVTPKKAESGKKRAVAGSESNSGAPEKKAKLVTPAGKTGAQDSKKGGHTATPYPNKQAAKTPKSAAMAAAKPQTPKSAGSISCKSCSKTFNSDGALQSHTKAKHTK